MAEKILGVVLGLIPVFILLPFITNLFAGFFGGGAQTRSVTKTNVLNVSRVELQKTFVSTRRNYGQIFLKIKNNTGTAQNYYIRIGAFFDNQGDAFPVGSKEIYANKITLANGEVATANVVSPIGTPEDSQKFLNKWIIAEFGAPADVEIFGYSESEV
jgi:hypothetical protein